MGTAFNRGSILFEHRRYEPAIREFSRELEAEPNSAKAMSMLALCHLRLGHFAAARQAAESAIAAQPEYDWGHYVLGWTLYCDAEFVSRCARDAVRGRLPTKWNRLKLARAAAEEALRISPRNSEVLLLCARISLSELNAHKALALVNAGAEANPQSAECLRLRAQILRTFGDLIAAEAAAAQALALEPENALSHITAGYGALHAFKFEQACDHFLQALRIDPMSERARLGLISVLRYRAAIHVPIYGAIVGWSRLFVMFLQIPLRKLLGRHAPNVMAGMSAGLSPLGNYLLLFDEIGTTILTPRERMFAIAMAALTPAGMIIGTIVALSIGDPTAVAWQVTLAIAVVVLVSFLIFWTPVIVRDWRNAGRRGP